MQNLDELIWVLSLISAMPSKICKKAYGRVAICCPFCFEQFGKLATHLKDEKSPCSKIMREKKFTRKAVLTARRESIRKFGVYHMDKSEYKRLWKEHDPVLALCETLRLPISDELKSASNKPTNKPSTSKQPTNKPSASKQLTNKILMPFIRIPKLSGQTPVDLRYKHTSCNCKSHKISSHESGAVQKAPKQSLPIHLKVASSLATRSLERRRLSRSKSCRK